MKRNIIIFKRNKMYHMLILKFHEKKIFSKKYTLYLGRDKYEEAVQLCYINIISCITIWVYLNVNSYV